MTDWVKCSIMDDNPLRRWLSWGTRIQVQVRTARADALFNSPRRGPRARFVVAAALHEYAVA